MLSIQRSLLPCIVIPVCCHLILRHISFPVTSFLSKQWGFLSGLLESQQRWQEHRDSIFWSPLPTLSWRFHMIACPQLRNRWWPRPLVGSRAVSSEQNHSAGGGKERSQTRINMLSGLLYLATPNIEFTWQPKSYVLVDFAPEVSLNLHLHYIYRYANTQKRLCRLACM